MGYTKVTIMEEVPDEISDGGINRKFREILKQFNPRFIFAFFHRDCMMDAVAFEIGYICCLYGDDIKDRLKFLYEKDFKFEIRFYCLY